MRLLLVVGVVAARDNGPVAVAPLEDLELATFEENGTMVHLWKELYDPVMGGLSYGTFEVVDEVGAFNGTVEDVPKLNAPGFAQMYTSNMFHVDASAYLEGGIKMEIMSTTPEYEGYKFSFKAIGAPHHHGGHQIYGEYKAPFELNTTEWTTVVIPFDQFSWDWSDFTGDCDTVDPDGFQHACCSVDETRCPDAARLQAITGLAIWAEGAKGDFYLEVKSIHATMNISTVALS